MVFIKLSSVGTFSLLLILGITANSSMLAATLGQNLIVNGNAEAGSCDPVGDAVGSSIPSIPNWTPSNSFSVLCYDATGFEFVNQMGQTVRVSGLPSSSDPGPGDRGNNLFYGGAERASSSAFQIINLTSNEDLIDKSQLGYTLSGWLGGYGTDNDNVSLMATFWDGVGQTLGTATLFSPTPAQRNNFTGLFYQSAVGAIPVGTRQVNLLLEMNHVRGRVNDAYADNLSFVVAPIPEPSSVVGLGIALSFGSLLKGQKNHKKNNNKV